MKYSDYVIDEIDWKRYEEASPSKVDNIWQDLLSRLPKRLQAEAKRKGFNLKPDPELQAQFYTTFMIEIPEASAELKKALTNLHKQIIRIEE